MTISNILKIMVMIINVFAAALLSATMHGVDKKGKVTLLVMGLSVIISDFYLGGII